MKLSEAILLGSMSCPKAIGLRHAHDGSKCALGAAEFAIGINDYSQFGTTLRRFPILLMRVTHPMVFALNCPLVQVITELNNGHSWMHARKFEPWSRERIADFVQTIERKIGTSTQGEIRAEAGDSRESVTPDCSPAMVGA